MFPLMTVITVYYIADLQFFTTFIALLLYYLAYNIKLAKN